MIPTSEIKERMQVFGSDGVLVGVVDYVEREGRIKLTKADSADGEHHFISMSLVDHVGDRIYLSKPAEAVMDEWESEDDLGDIGMLDIEQSPELEQDEWIERTR